MFSRRKPVEHISPPQAEVVAPFNAMRPAYDHKVGEVPAVCHVVEPGQVQWYPPVMIGAETLAARIVDGGYITSAMTLMKTLTPDDYTRFLVSFYEDGLKRFGERWHYADIVTVLMCLADYLKPRAYLEVGVRRGRSVSAVASLCPDCALTMFDMWVQDYAGMANPGPEFVKAELLRVGHVGDVSFIDGNSHETLPAFFSAQPDAAFDLVTIDGDHSPEGAALDLAVILPRLRVGGAVVFDDIAHPAHPELSKLWHDLVATDPRFSSSSFSDVGYGVGFAIRKH